MKQGLRRGLSLLLAFVFTFSSVNMQALAAGNGAGDVKVSDLAGSIKAQEELFSVPDAGIEEDTNQEGDEETSSEEDTGKEKVEEESSDEETGEEEDGEDASQNPEEEDENGEDKEEEDKEDKEEPGEESEDTEAGEEGNNSEELSEESGDEEEKEEKESSAFSYEETVDGYRISVKAKEGAVPEETEVRIEKISASEGIRELIEDKLDVDETIREMLAFHISLWLEEEEIQPQGSLSISVELSSAMADKMEEETAKLQVFCTDGEKNIRAVDSKLSKNKKLTFPSGEFSGYAVVLLDGDDGLLKVADRFASGSGTKLSPYYISSKDQLYYFAQYVEEGRSTSDTYYELHGTITFKEGEVWTPITVSGGFKGHFNGAYGKISNITVAPTEEMANSGGTYIGLFGSNAGEIEDMTIENGTIVCDGRYAYAGLIAGTGSGTIKDCLVEGNTTVVMESTVSASSTPVVGLIAGRSAKTENCRIEGNVSLETPKSVTFGGIVGSSSSEIVNCKNCAEIILSSEYSSLTAYMGGIAGTTAGVVRNCKNEGTIKLACTSASNVRLGGIIGDNSSATVSDCVNTDSGSVILDASSLNTIRVAGIAGTSGGHIRDCQNNGQVSAGERGNVAGIVADKSGSGNIIGCSNTVPLTGGAVSGIIGEASSDKSYQITGCFNTGDLTGTYVSGIAKEIASIRDGVTSVTECYNTGNLKGSEAAGICGEISANQEESLVVMTDCYNTGDIDARSSAGIVRESIYLGKAGSAVIENCYNTGKVPQGAGIVAWLSNRCTVRNCYNTSDSVTAGIVQVMGFYGSYNSLENTIVEGCYNTGNIKSGTSCSGIVGNIYTGTIRRCYNAGNLESSDSSAAGILLSTFGSSYGGSVMISDCYNCGEIKGSDGAGGIIGSLWAPEKEEDKCVVKNCYNVGAINGNRAYSGAVAGDVIVLDTLKGEIVLQNCYYKDNISAIGVGYSEPKVDTSGCHSCTQEEMKTQGTYVGFDFSNIWEMGSGDYPYPILLEKGESKNGQSGDIIWDIDEYGTLTVTGTGDWARDGIENMPPWRQDAKLVKKAVVTLTGTTDASRMFYGCYRMTEADLSGFQTSAVTSMKEMFRGCSKLTDLTFAGGSAGSTALVTDMSGMFQGCHSIKELDLGSFQTGNVTSMDSLFNDCNGLESVNLSSFTTTKLTDMGCMFFRCHALKSLDLSNFDISGVTDLYAIFTECKSLMTLRTPKNVTKAETLAGRYFDAASGSYMTELPTGKSSSITLTKDFEGKFSFSATNVKGSKIRDFTYNEGWFSIDSTKYQHDLARMSLKTAMAAFDIGGSNRAGNIKDLMDTLGFSYTNTSVSYPRPEYDTIGYAIGSKTIYTTDGQEESLILVAVRGGGYGLEWGGNFKINSNGSTNDTHHYGFSLAAGQVLDGLEAYLDANGDSLHTRKKIWLTGYSRAAATANMVAARLDDGRISGIGKDDVYAYCFECPKNTTDSDASDAKYGNIFSIVNPIDLVPKVAMGTWGYTRYGVTYYLPSKASRFDYKTYYKKMEKAYGNLELEYSDSIGQAFPAQEIWLDDFVRNLGEVAINPCIYYNLYQTMLSDAFASCMPKNDIAGLVEGIWPILALNVFNDLLHNLVPVLNLKDVRWTDADLAEGAAVLIAGGIKAHNPELCYAWMEALEDGKGLSKTYKARLAYTNCPVDITVTDGDGTVVAKILNDEPAETQDGITAYVDSNGQKVLVLPADEEYSVSLTATDSGKVTYTVVERNLATGKAERIVSYIEKEIAEDDVLQGTVENIEEDTASYSLTLQDGLDAVPDITLSGGEISSYQTEVSAEFGGRAEGGGSYLPGEYARVAAIPDSGAVPFAGWYDEEDNLVSTEAEYRFLIKDENVSLTAKFAVPEELWVGNIAPAVYSGSAIKPEVAVYSGSTLLTLNKDYTVAYKNNKNAYLYGDGEEGFSAGKAPTVTIKGKGNYSGTAAETFIIRKKDIGTDITYNDITLKAGTKAQKPAPVLKWGKKTLEKNKDYTLSYEDTGEGAYKSAGTWHVTVKGKGNYTGTLTVPFTIVAAKLISGAKVSAIARQAYTGGSIEPPLTVKDGKKLLKPGVDYTVSYENNVNIGTAKAIITGTGNYAGQKTATFSITGIPMSKVKISMTAASAGYTGGEITKESGEIGYTLTYKKNSSTPEVTLEEGEDYEVSYKKNLNAGDATVTFTGLKGYSGSVKKTVAITRCSLSDSRVKITNEEAITGTAAAYEKGGSKPEPEITFVNAAGETVTLTKGKDYTLAYANNLAVNDMSKSKKPAVTITGKGNFKGTKTLYFAIGAKALETLEESMTVADKGYTAKAGGYASVPEILDANGKKLESGTDFTTEYTYKTAVGVKNGNKAVERETGDRVDAKDIPGAGTVLTVTVKGKKNYSGTLTADYRITTGGLGKAEIIIAKQVYTGEAIRPEGEAVKVKTGGTILTEGEDYTIVGYANNTNKGTGKITIKGKGNYGGLKTGSFKIAAKSFNYTITYDKNNEQATGKMASSSTAYRTALSANAYKLKGHKFAGWNTEADGSGIAYANKEIFRLKSIRQLFGRSVTLYAQWKPAS